MLAAILVNIARLEGRDVIFGGRQFPAFPPTPDVSKYPSYKEYTKLQQKKKKSSNPFVKFTQPEIKKEIKRISEVADKIETPKLREKLDKVLTPYKNYDIIEDIDIDDNISNINLSNIDYNNMLDNKETIAEVQDLIDWVDEEEAILLLVS